MENLIIENVQINTIFFKLQSKISLRNPFLICQYMCRETPQSEKTCLWQLPKVSSVFIKYMYMYISILFEIGFKDFKASVKTCEGNFHVFSVIKLNFILEPKTLC